jgi:serine/threonine-protein kinase
VSPALARALRGDLDNIVLMALRKEPERRYGSVEQMMDDIERYRRGLPVRARPDTLAYRTQKFVRRHAVGVATVAAFGLVLVSYAATVTHQARQLSRERDRAQTEARKAERVRDFLVGLFEAADPSQAKGEQVTAAELVDAGARQAREGLAAEPEVQAEMLGVLGKVLHERASYARAEPLLAEALAIQRRLHPDGHVDLARALDAYVAIVVENGDLPRAEQLAREALAMRRRLFDAHRPEVAEGLEALSVAISLQGRFVEAETVLREALAIRQRLPGQDAKLAETWNDLGVQLAKQRRHVEAEAAYRTGIAIERRVYPPDHPNIAAGLGNLAVTLQQRGRFDEAEALYRETLEARRRVFGSEHPLVGNVLFNIASLQRRRGRTAEAVATHREALAIRRKAFGEKSSQVALSWHGLASALRDAGRPAEAEPLYREAITVFRATGHWAHGVCALNLGRLLVAAGQLDEGERLLNEALAVSVAREGDASVTADEARLGLGLCRAAQRRPAEARQMLEPTLARLRGRADPEPGLVAEAEAALARLPE